MVSIFILKMKKGEIKIKLKGSGDASQVISAFGRKRQGDK